MKPIAVAILLCGVVFAQTPGEKFHAERLSDDEIKQLSDARAEVEKAQKSLAAIEWSIKFKHGNSTGWGVWLCGREIVDVEIRENWALITKTPPQTCIATTTNGTVTYDYAH